MFQDSEIILREKNFSDFQTNLSPGISMRFQRHKLRFTCNQRRRTLPVRIAWKGDWSSCVSLRCGSASRGKNFSKSKNFFNFFSKQVFSMFQDSEIILREKNFSDFQTNLCPGIAMRFQRQKLPFTCNQRRRTLPVRIAWKGDWSSCVSLRCGSASQGARSTGAGGQWGRTSWGWTSLGHNPWGRTSWGRTSLGHNPWGRTSWDRRSVGQDVVGQNFVGQDVTGAKSLGQNFVGQDVTGAISLGQ